MRRIGRYALLDLREHPGENDKIRPNKNYHADPGENNAYIVYSDVVVEPPEGMLYEILDRAAPEGSAHMALTMPLPGTQRVLFRAEDGGVAPALWRVAAMEGVEGAVELSREEARICPGTGEEHACPDLQGKKPVFFWRAGRIAACGRAANRGRLRLRTPRLRQENRRSARPRACAHA